MKISIRSATATGPTKLAAFDAALLRAGVANFNLVRLSSVIPPKTEVEKLPRASALDGGWGDKLYCVYAECRVDQTNEEAWAGVAWVQDESGRGLFVEHEGFSENQLRMDLEASIKSLVKSRGGEFGEIQMEVTGVTCKGEPVCALVIAPYSTEGWS